MATSAAAAEVSAVSAVPAFASACTCCVLVTKPSHFPSPHWTWVACQLCDGTPRRWLVEGW